MLLGVSTHCCKKLQHTGRRGYIVPDAVALHSEFRNSVGQG